MNTPQPADLVVAVLIKPVGGEDVADLTAALLKTLPLEIVKPTRRASKYYWVPDEEFTELPQNVERAVLVIAETRSVLNEAIRFADSTNHQRDLVTCPRPYYSFGSQFTETSADYALKYSSALAASV